jgi:hypothetical protein
MMVAALTSTAARTCGLARSRYWITVQKWVPNLRASERRRCESICAEALELVDMDDERRPLFGCLITKRQGDKLAVLRLAGVE